MLFGIIGHGSDEDGNYGLDYYYTTTITPTPITPTRCNGKTLNDIDAFYEDPDFNYYITAHEQSLGHAATGYAKVSGKTGVAIVTSGPGLTNMVTPILDATNDSAPLLCLSGQVPLSAMGLSAFQECPATEITKSITKWNYCLQSTEEIPYVIDHAMWVAQHGKKGAVHIDVPKCVSAGKYCSNKAMDLSDEIFNMCSHNENPESDEFYLYSYHDDNLEKANKKSQEYVGQITNLQYPYDGDKFQEMAELINNAKSPIFYIGQGCENACDLLTEAAQIGQIPVTTTLYAMGVFDETNELALKMCGMHGSYAANHALQNADLIIAIGSRFDDRTTGNLTKYAPKAKEASENGTCGMIHVNISPCQINKVLTTDYNFLMCSRDFMEGILPYLTAPKQPKLREEWLNTIHKWKIKYPFQFFRAHENKIKTQDVIKGINQYVHEYVRPTGVGNHQMYSTQFIDWYRPNKIVSSGSLGVMGSSNGYAIGAQIADLNNNVVISIDGDGSFNMTTSELMSMVKYNLPIKIALMNDGSLTMVKIWEKLFYDERYVATHNPCNPDYVLLAQSYGIKGIRCDNVYNLNDSIKELMESDGPVLCEFKVLGEECYPLVAPGKALDDMILWDTTYEEKQKQMEGQMAPS
eukprot:415614_1